MSYPNEIKYKYLSAKYKGMKECVDAQREN